MTPEEAALRQRYSAEGTWTGERVRDALRAAWRAYGEGKKTVEHATIMNWPAVYLTVFPCCRIALHYMGLAEMRGHRLADLIQHRLRCARSTYEERIRSGSDLIAQALNRKGQVSP